MAELERSTIKVGFIPIIDCAAIVLAEELARHATPEAALTAYRNRRFERCAYIVRSSLAICMGQLGKGPPVDNAKATGEMFAVTAEPI